MQTYLVDASSMKQVYTIKPVFVLLLQSYINPTGEILSSLRPVISIRDLVRLKNSGLS